VPVINVTEIAAQGNHTCVRRADASTWCWGWNGFGQLGNGGVGGIDLFPDDFPQTPFPTPVVTRASRVARRDGGERIGLIGERGFLQTEVRRRFLQ